MKFGHKMLSPGIWLTLAILLIGGGDCLAASGSSATSSSASGTTSNPAAVEFDEDAERDFESIPDSSTPPLDEFTPAQLVTDPRGLTARVGFVAFRRADQIGVPLNPTSAEQKVDFDSTTSPFHWNTGIDLELSHRIGEEAVITGWNARLLGFEGTTSPGLFDTHGPWTLPGSASLWPSAQFSSRYDSRLASAEWNLVRDDGNDRFTLLAGIRWLNLKDSLLGNAQFTPAESLHLRVNTSNNLLGGQVGAAVRFWKENTPLEIGVRLKTGLYDDLGKAESSIQKISAAGNPTWTGYHTGNRIAFVGDFEFDLIYRLTDHWSTQFGYQLLWLEGLTLADRQTQLGTVLAGSPTFDTGGGAWFNGITAGIRFHW